MKILCQREIGFSPEIRSIRQYALTHEAANAVESVGIPFLGTLNIGSYDLAAGSVEFMTRVFRRLGVEVPPNLSYPEELENFLGRDVTRVPAASTLIYLERGQPLFVKPVNLKAFSGFIYQGLDYPRYDEHDQEQVKSLLKTDSDVWVSEVVQFQCEWRYYVLNGKVIGKGRYDPDGLDDAPEPDMSIVEEAAAQFKSAPCAYTLDFGVTSDGATVLVEANDAWAIGLYHKALSPVQYFQFLRARYIEIKNGRTPV